jgi:uncharacterized protein (TIGR00730 family)
VFCGSSHGSRPEFAQAADSLGRILAADGIELVYGGGNVGLMGVLADAVMAAGGHVIGVIPEHLEQAEVAHRAVSSLEVVDDMHQRKARMVELADGFVALPGGLGTFEELFEQLTWLQLGLHDKPVVLFDVAGYYAPLLDLMRRAVDEGFMRPETLELLPVADSARQALELLRVERPDLPPKWMR